MSSAAAEKLITCIASLANGLGSDKGSTKACRQHARSLVAAVNAEKPSSYDAMDASASAKIVVETALHPLLDRIDATDMSGALLQAQAATGLLHVARQLRPLAELYDGSGCAMPRELDASRFGVGSTAPVDSKAQCAMETARRGVVMDIFTAAPTGPVAMHAPFSQFPCGVDGAGPIDGEYCGVAPTAHPRAQEAFLDSMVGRPLAPSGGEMFEPWMK